MPPIEEPASEPDLRAQLLDYLDYYRDQVAVGVSRLPVRLTHASAVPSGWTPAGLLNHLDHMERRWFQWGFLAEDVPQPWGDRTQDGWVTPDLPVEDLLGRLHATGRRTREIVEAADLSTPARVGGRFSSDPPHLHWILLHVLQEYARHAGHLDIVVEQATHH